MAIPSRGGWTGLLGRFIPACRRIEAHARGRAGWAHWRDGLRGSASRACRHPAGSGPSHSLGRGDNAMRHPRSSSAFTLTELLVAALIVAVLVGLAVPGLSKARQRAVELKCMTGMRSAGAAIFAYAADYRGRLPYAGDHQREVVTGEGRTFLVGGVGGLSSGRWSLLFPDHWSGDRWSRGLMCPRQAPFDPEVPTSTPRADGSFLLPTVWLTSAAWLDAASLKADLPHEALAPRPNSICDVVFPSAKACLFEQISWCSQGPETEFWKRVAGQTPYVVSTIGLFDASVARMRRVDALSAVHSLPLDLTIDGVRGRDIER